MLNLVKCFVKEMMASKLPAPFNFLQTPKNDQKIAPPPPLALNIGRKWRARSICPPDPCPIDAHCVSAKKRSRSSTDRTMSFKRKLRKSLNTSCSSYQISPASDGFAGSWSGSHHDNHSLGSLALEPMMKIPDAVKASDAELAFPGAGSMPAPVEPMRRETVLSNVVSETDHEGNSPAFLQHDTRKFENRPYPVSPVVHDAMKKVSDVERKVAEMEMIPHHGTPPAGYHFGQNLDAASIERMKKVIDVDDTYYRSPLSNQERAVLDRLKYSNAVGPPGIGSGNVPTGDSYGVGGQQHDRAEDHKKLRLLVAEGAKDISAVLDRLAEGFSARTPAKTPRPSQNNVLEKGVGPPQSPHICSHSHHVHDTPRTCFPTESHPINCASESIRTIAVLTLLGLCGICFLPLKTWHGSMALIVVMAIWIRRKDLFRHNPWLHYL